MSQSCIPIYRFQKHATNFLRERDSKQMQKEAAATLWYKKVKVEGTKKIATGREFWLQWTQHPAKKIAMNPESQ